MIILNKKRIILVVTSVFLSIFVFMLTTKENEENYSVTPTVSLPVSGKTIVIDARASEYQMRVLKVQMELLKHKLI